MNYLPFKRLTISDFLIFTDKLMCTYFVLQKSIFDLRKNTRVPRVRARWVVFRRDVFPRGVKSVVPCQ